MNKPSLFIRRIQTGKTYCIKLKINALCAIKIDEVPDIYYFNKDILLGAPLLSKNALPDIPVKPI
jgi:hypothetical protein